MQQVRALYIYMCQAGSTVEWFNLTSAAEQQ